MRKDKYKIAELEAQILFMKKFITKVQEKNEGVIPPTKEEIAYMQKEVSNTFYQKKGIIITFE